MTKRHVVIAAIVIVAIGGWWLLRKPVTTPGEESSSTPGEVTGPVELAPSFSLMDYEGNVVSLADFAGMPVVINAWAAWCPFCVKELPDLVAVQKEFAGEVVFIAIDRAESREVAKGFTDELGVTGGLIFLLDPRDEFYVAIGGFTMPETIFVKPDGTIHFHKRGFMTREEIRQRTQELL